MGNETCAPQVYAGNKDEGFVVVEDLASKYSLDRALWTEKCVARMIHEARSDYYAVVHCKRSDFAVN
jgi:hypothetical protein